MITPLFRSRQAQRFPEQIEQGRPGGDFQVLPRTIDLEGERVSRRGIHRRARTGAWLSRRCTHLNNLLTGIAQCGIGSMVSSGRRARTVRVYRLLDSAGGLRGVVCGIEESRSPSRPSRQRGAASPRGAGCGPGLGSGKNARARRLPFLRYPSSIPSWEDGGGIRLTGPHPREVIQDRRVRTHCVDRRQSRRSPNRTVVPMSSDKVGKKLRLHKETLVNLSDASLGQVAGAVAEDAGATCQSCFGAGVCRGGSGSRGERIFCCSAGLVLCQADQDLARRLA